MCAFGFQIAVLLEGGRFPIHHTHSNTHTDTHTHTHAHTYTLTSLTLQDCGQVLPRGGSNTHTDTCTHHTHTHTHTHTSMLTSPEEDVGEVAGLADGAVPAQPLRVDGEVLGDVDDGARQPARPRLREVTLHVRHCKKQRDSIQYLQPVMCTRQCNSGSICWLTHRRRNSILCDAQHVFLCKSGKIDILSCFLLGIFLEVKKCFFPIVKQELCVCVYVCVSVCACVCV